MRDDEAIQIVIDSVRSDIDKQEKYIESLKEEEGQIQERFEEGKYLPSKEIAEICADISKAERRLSDLKSREAELWEEYSIVTSDLPCEDCGCDW